jgi:hypothetical protein
MADRHNQTKVWLCQSEIQNQVNIEELKEGWYCPKEEVGETDYKQECQECA